MTNAEIATIFDSTPQQVSRWRKAGMPVDDLWEAFYWLMTEHPQRGRQPKIIGGIATLIKKHGDAAFWHISSFWCARIAALVAKMRAGWVEYTPGDDPAFDADLEKLDRWAEGQDLNGGAVESQLAAAGERLAGLSV